MKIYYEDIDGTYEPKWVLLDGEHARNKNEFTIKSPFERFFPEDFHDDLVMVTVTQGALTVSPVDLQTFSINFRQLEEDLGGQPYATDNIYSAHYFVLLVDDLQELLSFSLPPYL